MTRLKLEVFEALPATSEEADRAAAVEEIRLAAFEQGYSAGWEDASAAETASQHRLRAEIAHQLQEQAFTYHEARDRALADLEPLLRAMAEAVLPQVARAALAPLIIEAITELAAKRCDRPVELRLNPEDALAMEPVLRLQAQAPLALRSDETLAPGQVWLRGPDREASIDIGDACRRICDAVRDHFHSEPEMRQHG